MKKSTHIKFVIIILTWFCIGIANAAIPDTSSYTSVEKYIQICSTKQIDQNDPLYLASWNQCQSSSDCGVGYHCCDTSDGTRCYPNNTAC